MKKISVKRREQIYQMILQQTRMKVKDIVKQFDVSQETIRKDLNLLEEQGFIHKTHGWVQVKNEYYQLPTTIKVNEHAYEKEQIARKAMEWIVDDSTIYLDPSSTCLKIARFLPLRKNLTIVTNSLAIAQAVSQTKHELIFLGGYMIKKSNATTGMFACDMIDSIQIDIAFNGTDGLNDEIGPTTFSKEEREIKNRVIRRAKYNVLVCDDSKFDKSAQYIFSKYTDFDMLITNENGKTCPRPFKKIVFAL